MNIPLACDMTATPPADRGEHRRVTRHLVAKATDILDLPGGVMLQLPAEEFDNAVSFIGKERLCCPFLRFGLEMTPGGGPIRLRLDGPPGSGAFLRAELHLP